MNASMTHPSPGIPRDNMESNPPSRGEDYGNSDIACDEEDERIRATQFVSGSVIFLDDFGISLND